MKLKTSWHFTKQDGLNIVIQYIRCFKNLCGSPNTLLHIPLKRIIKWRRSWVQCILSFSSSKILVCFWLDAQFLFFSNDHIHNVVSTLLNVVKIYVENDNVVSTSDVVQINVEIDNVGLTLFNVVNFNVDVHNVVSTLIWSCATSRRHIIKHYNMHYL